MIDVCSVHASAVHACVHTANDLDLSLTYKTLHTSFIRGIISKYGSIQHSKTQ